MGKNTQKPSTEQIYLLCRGAWYLWRQPNIPKAEYRANLFAMSRRRVFMAPAKHTQKPSTEQIYLLRDLRLEGRGGISGEDERLIPRLQSPGVV